jgi:hypothetical protein
MRKAIRACFINIDQPLDCVGAARKLCPRGPSIERPSRGRHQRPSEAKHQRPSENHQRPSEAIRGPMFTCPRAVGRAHTLAYVSHGERGGTRG